MINEKKHNFAILNTIRPINYEYNQMPRVLSESIFIGWNMPTLRCIYTRKYQAVSPLQRICDEIGYGLPPLLHPTGAHTGTRGQCFCGHFPKRGKHTTQ